MASEKLRPQATTHCRLPTAHLRMSELTQSVVQLVNEFAKLPGIGKKSAERLAYHILRIHRNEAMALADAIRNVKDNVQYCRRCYNLAEGEQCAICQRSEPTAGRLLCVVEQPRDLMALEQSGVYRGLYHVLLGRIAPLDGMGPEQLTIDALVRAGPRGGLQGDDHGDQPNGGRGRHGVAHLQPVGRLPIHITRLARGITTGSVLEFANKEILADAMTGRQEF